MEGGWGGRYRGVFYTQSSCRYLQSTVAAAAFALEPADVAEIESVLVLSTGPGGSVYGLERGMAGPHASIMKYNLSQLNQAAHLEELCHRLGLLIKPPPKPADFKPVSSWLEVCVCAWCSVVHISIVRAVTWDCSDWRGGLVSGVL